MYIKNTTNTFQNVQYNGGSSWKQVAPGDTVNFGDAPDDDPTLTALIEQGKFEKVTPKDAQETKDAKDEKRKQAAEVMEKEESHGKDVATTVHCPAMQKDGTVCDRVVTLKDGETNDEPHFCSLHKGKKADNKALYSQNDDGKWVYDEKKAEAVEKEEEKDEKAEKAKKDDKKSDVKKEADRDAKDAKDNNRVPTIAPKDSMKPVQSADDVTPVFEDE